MLPLSAVDSFIPALGPIAPPPNAWLTGVAVLQTMATLTSFAAETTKPTAYSKFASGIKLDNPISSQLGMFGIYIPATITSLTSGSFVATLLFLHFMKRTLEVGFLHKYSGQMPANNSIFIGIYYALLTFLILSTASDPVASPTLLNVGVVLFGIGEVGNLYHHYLLRKLREQKTSYVAPRGGLFEFVATPHYLFELIAWLGIALVAQQLNAVLVFCSMASYLAGRSSKTNELYRDKFDETEWPKSRKNLIPFIF